VPKAAVFSVVTGLVGVTLLVASRAATPTAAVEAEAGTINGGTASQVADSSASGNSAVRFAAGSGSGDVCATYPALPGSQPNSSNSGVPAGTNLTAYTGSLTISTPGTVIDSKIINGDLKITADNVTVQNSRITGDGYYTVNSTAGTGVKLLHNEISSTSDGQKYIGVLGKYELICGNYVHGYENAMSMYQGGATIQANYIDRFDAGVPSPHYDGIEVYGGSDYKIWGNTIKLTNVSDGWLGDTGAINVSDDSGIINNIQINGNWLGGGSYTLYVDDKFAYSISNAQITNNVFLGAAPTGHAAFGPMLIRTPSTVTANTNNTWENGQAL